MLFGLIVGQFVHYKYCPELSKLRMLDIDNRVGPLVIGFYLQIIGDGTIYMPLYKVGNLYSHYSVLPSSLEIEGRSMDMQMHEISHNHL